jgi:hypothetical protein
MFDIGNLVRRINLEFSSSEEKDKESLGGQEQVTAQQQRRLEQLGNVFDELREVWKPRLELLVKEFAKRIQVSPHVVPSERDVTFTFQSSKAHVKLRFSALPDRDFQRLILAYLLEITPAVIHFKTYDQLEFPLNAVDRQLVAKWMDDRIMDFVQTYLSVVSDQS